MLAIVILRNSKIGTPPDRTRDLQISLLPPRPQRPRPIRGRQMGKAARCGGRHTAGKLSVRRSTTCAVPTTRVQELDKIEPATIPFDGLPTVGFSTLCSSPRNNDILQVSLQLPVGNWRIAWGLLPRPKCEGPARMGGGACSGRRQPDPWEGGACWQW